MTVETHRPMFGESGYQRQANDAYWTPAWCTEALLDRFEFAGCIWECAAGTGAMTTVFSARTMKYVATDIVDHGGGFQLWDFLKGIPLLPLTFKHIITNPPYEHAEAFIRRSLEATRSRRSMVAMLLRNEYDCASSRVDLFDEEPFRAKLVLTRRPRWSADEKASPRHNFAWFVWDWQHKGQAQIIYQARAAA